MRQMEKAWNKTMADEFNPYSINVLDNNMMEWYNKFAPGFMCVGQKPNNFGNGLHIICFWLTSIVLGRRLSKGSIDRHRWAQSVTWSME